MGARGCHDAEVGAGAVDSLFYFLCGGSWVPGHCRRGCTKLGGRVAACMYRPSSCCSAGRRHSRGHRLSAQAPLWSAVWPRVAAPLSLLPLSPPRSPLQLSLPPTPPPPLRLGAGRAVVASTGISTSTGCRWYLGRADALRSPHTGGDETCARWVRPRRWGVGWPGTTARRADSPVVVDLARVSPRTPAVTATAVVRGCACIGLGCLYRAWGGNGVWSPIGEIGREEGSVAIPLLIDDHVSLYFFLWGGRVGEDGERVCGWARSDGGSEGARG